MLALIVTPALISSACLSRLVDEEVGKAVAEAVAKTLAKNEAERDKAVAEQKEKNLKCLHKAKRVSGGKCVRECVSLHLRVCYMQICRYCVCCTSTHIVMRVCTCTFKCVYVTAYKCEFISALHRFLSCASGGSSMAVPLSVAVANGM